MPEEPSRDSQPVADPKSRDASIAPAAPAGTLTDGRPLWVWESKYTGGAWAQIALEGAYLALVLLAALAIFICFGLGFLTDSLKFPGLVGPARTTFVTWASVGLGGVCGGCCFALKWLYHGVAYGKWHRDRIVWRLVVPLLSGVIAVFTGLMVASGFLPILNKTVFDGVKIGAAFGFFVGFFSDNLIAVLQRLANQFFGTLENPKRGNDI